MFIDPQTFIDPWIGTAFADLWYRGILFTIKLNVTMYLHFVAQYQLPCSLISFSISILNFRKIPEVSFLGSKVSRTSMVLLKSSRWLAPKTSMNAGFTGSRRSRLRSRCKRLSICLFLLHWRIKRMTEVSRLEFVGIKETLDYPNLPDGWRKIGTSTCV